MGRPEPITSRNKHQLLQERLAMIGVVVTPSTVRPGTPVRPPLDVAGVSLSDAVIEARRENETRP
jgi:hypothetical protein